MKNSIKYNLDYPKLPKGWIWVRLDACVEILDSQRIPVNSDEREKRIFGKSKESLYPYYGATGQVGWIDEFIFDGEFILLGEDGAPFLDGFSNKAYLVNGKFWVNNHAHVLKAINGISINKFICNYLNIFNYQGFVTGTTRLKLNQSRMREIPIPLPPLPEQQRIVSKIEELFTKLDAGVDALKKAKEQIKRYRQAVLKYAFEGKLTEEWREANLDKLEPAPVLLERIKEERKKKLGKKYKEIPPIDTSELPELPKGWMWVRLGEIIYFIKGKKPKNLGDKNEFLKFPYINIEAFELKRFYQYTDGENCPTCEPDDILIVWDGARCGLVGRGVKGVIGSTLAKLECSGINKSLLYYFLQTQYEYINKHPRGVGIPHVEPNLFWNISFPFPPLTEQQKIVEEIERRFSVADEVEKAIDNSLKQAERLRQSILKMAFEGKLVPQDPNDEPADKLLERVRKSLEL